LARRRSVEEAYCALLRDVEGIAIPEVSSGTDSNAAYFPILVLPEFRLTRDELHRHLYESNVVSRRYFYPLLSEMAPYKSLPSAARNNLPNAFRIAEQVLCLPIHADLSDGDVELVASIVRG
jgi:dTDP-4-amino-4,6-dideoxygalactose transaminase